MSRDDAAQVEVQRYAGEGGVPVISVSGELDISNADALESAIDAALASAPAQIVFDFGGLTFMDSAGIAVLVGATSKVDGIRVRDPSPPVRRVIELTGLSSLLALEP